MSFPEANPPPDKFFFQMTFPFPSYPTRVPPSDTTEPGGNQRTDPSSGQRVYACKLLSSYSRPFPPHVPFGGTRLLAVPGPYLEIEKNTPRSSPHPELDSRLFWAFG